MATAEHPAASRPLDVPEDWPAVIHAKVWIGREDGYWFALCEDFDIAGQGDSADQAVSDMSDSVVGYLSSCAREGMDWSAARRPIPARTRVRLHLRSLVLLPLRVFSWGGALRERDVLIPQPPALGHC